ncbi:TPA: FAD-dependent oxidoreductase [Burkholderia cenocepacia]|uniref:FAD-binding protein n=1 Tax=unclassified Burkholderia TaxID=2613784 RepID=UPI00158BDE9D|nr:MULTISPECIES: FAD-binding protein [unclassified Burkholderia]HEF5873870.1 FAD-dependent oxidoreductase [Burkholderia cenocepacia]
MEPKRHIDCDVLVVGSGAGGMLAAIRAHDLGQRSVVMEKTHYFGGTSALSGGQIWAPNHQFLNGEDSVEKAKKYLVAITNGNVREDRIDAFLAAAPNMTRYLEEIGVGIVGDTFPDYFMEVDGSMFGRSVAPKKLDGKALGPMFFEMREPSHLWKAGHRIALDWPDMHALIEKPSGWQFSILKLFARYWTDISWRRITRRDRRVTMGAALVCALRIAMKKRGIPLMLNMRMTDLVESGGRVSGATFDNDGREISVRAAKGVIIAAGGFEHNQTLRDTHALRPTSAGHSIAPGVNTGDGLLAAQDVGAGTEMMGHFWWTPVAVLPDPHVPNSMVPGPVFRSPGCILVRSDGERFVNESSSYDRIGNKVLAEGSTRRSSDPYWMIFDSRYRANYPIGNLLPSSMASDKTIPREWWNRFIYKADTVSELASLTGLPSEQLNSVVTQMNEAAKTGKDSQFGRGDSLFDQMMSGERSASPNPSLVSIDKPPFYAIRIYIGDIGSKGGIRVNANAQVEQADGTPIPGLYAIGNSSASPFGDSYPGAGATLGAAMTFGYIAAAHLAA